MAKQPKEAKEPKAAKEAKEPKQAKQAKQAKPEQAEKKQPAKAEDFSYVVKNKKARAATKHRKAITIVGIIILILLLLAGVIYGFYTALKVNQFKIYIEASGSKKLSLATNPDMIPSSEMIEIVGPEKMTNTSFAHGKNLVNSTPIENRLIEIISGEGSITNVDDYFIAGTFYMKNITDQDMLYSECVRFNKSSDARHALRIMLIRNDEIRVYADGKTDSHGDYIYVDDEGNRIYHDDEGYYYTVSNMRVPVEENGHMIAEEVVPIDSIYTERRLATDAQGNYYIEVSEGNTPWVADFFHGEEYAIKNDNILIKPGERVKYSVIIWFEGWDPDCKDELLKSGELELSLSFSVN